MRARDTDWEGVRLHVVTGKGGTGKTTWRLPLLWRCPAAAARCLLIEVEGRQGIARLFDCPPLPYAERKVGIGPGRGRAARWRPVRAGRRPGGRAPGLPGDVLRDAAHRPGADPAGAGRLSPPRSRPGCRTCCGPARPPRRPGVRPAGREVYDAVVMDAPPTGRIGRFLNVCGRGVRPGQGRAGAGARRYRGPGDPLAADRGAFRHHAWRRCRSRRPWTASRSCAPWAACSWAASSSTGSAPAGWPSRT